MCQKSWMSMFATAMVLSTCLKKQDMPKQKTNISTFRFYFFYNEITSHNISVLKQLQSVGIRLHIGRNKKNYGARTQCLFLNNYLVCVLFSCFNALGVN